jgi:hypothetical protein
MKEKDNGDMTTGLMCLGCSRITQANTMFWSNVYKPRKNNVPVVYLLCPDCRFINPINVNYMVIE